MNFRMIEVELHDHARDKQRRRTKTIAFVWPKGESIMENLVNRRSRPIKQFRKAVNQALDSLGVDKNNLTISWRQKAGCPCGCSPGFIIDGWDSVLHRKDVHITITGE